jgi:hypothetical protein
LLGEEQARKTILDMRGCLERSFGGVEEASLSRHIKEKYEKL